MFCMFLPSSYCSTMAGTRPHFPAVNTCPPSTAMASAPPRCRIGETAICLVKGSVGQNTAKVFFHISSPQCFTKIIFRHSSTVEADWHWMTKSSPSWMLKRHSSHFSVSALPTAHHLMELVVGAVNPAERRRARRKRQNISSSPKKTQNNKIKSKCLLGA